MVVWLIIIFSSMLVGGGCFYFLGGRRAVIFSALISWCAFLLFNLYFEFFSRDKEIMQGSWLLFQLVLGPFVVLVSIVSGWLLNKILERR